MILRKLLPEIILFLPAARQAGKRGKESLITILFPVFLKLTGKQDFIVWVQTDQAFIEGFVIQCRQANSIDRVEGIGSNPFSRLERFIG